MQRIAVVGCPGSGKTALARELADKLHLAHIELDAILHKPGWKPMPDDAFAEQVSAATAAHIEFVQLRSRAEIPKWLDKWN